MSGLVTPRASGPAGLIALCFQEKLFELLDREGFFQLDISLEDGCTYIKFDKKYSFAANSVDRALLDEHLQNRSLVFEQLQRALWSSLGLEGASNG